MEYLAFLSVKEGIYLPELHRAMVEAKEKEKATCQNLTVEYRGTIKGEAIFLITKNTKVVVQFRVSEEILVRKNISFERWMTTDKIRRQMNKQNTSPTLSMMVQNLRHGMKKVNLEAKVLETQKPSIVQTRYGNSAKVTNAWIADETGKIKLCLWNEQADILAVATPCRLRTLPSPRLKAKGKSALAKLPL